MTARYLTHKNVKITLILLIYLVMILLSACTPTPTPTPTQTPEPTIDKASLLAATQTPTERPTATPTLATLGSAGNPIIVGFILTPEDTDAISASQDISFLIAQNTGFTVENAIYPDFQSMSTAAINGDVHLFWLGPLEYVYLHQQNSANAVLITNHLGVYAYGVQFMANAQRGFGSFFDANTNQSVGDPIAALQQFSGTRPCFLESTSLPGYIVPLGLLTNASTPTLEPVFTYSYNAMIRALYIQGICDFGVSYALTGDPRNSSDILLNIPEAQDEVKIIWQSEGIIPNINLSAHPQIPLDILFRLQEGILDLSNTPEGLPLLSTALNYDVEALKTIDDTFYNPFRTAIMQLEIDLSTVLDQQVEQ